MSEAERASSHHMQTDINTSLNLATDRFQRIYRLMNVLWLVVTIISLTSSSFAAFSDRPSYLHNWHLAAIILFSISLLTIYCVGIFRFHYQWPPPLSYALPRWLSLYILVTLLTLIDHNFVWSFFVVFGISFTLFRSYLLILLVSIIFVSLSIYQGLLTWPLTGANLGAMFGEGIGIFAMTAFSMMVQHLFSERYERNNLLQKLTTANAELEEAHRQLAESAAQEQELAVLRERTRLAREMHDTLGHALVLISVKLEAAQRLRDRDPERSDRELEATGEIVRNSMKDLRASIANLRSPALERESACRAISRYAREMSQRAGLRVTYDLHSDIEGLPEQVEETLWKVGQEALTNIEKHAHASNVLLHISRQNSHIFMKIQDDGVGLSPQLLQSLENGEMYTGEQLIGSADNQSPTPGGHYGIHGMIERVESLDGRLSLLPSSDHGTILEVELPLVEIPF
jgi:signal transduction histidine kinase